MRKTHALYGIMILIVFCFYSCAHQQVESKPVIVMVNDDVYETEVFGYHKHVLVLFHNDEWQSRDMKTRFEHFANEFQNDAKFCEYPMDEILKSDNRYGLETLPTVILYKRGAELDRLRGIPPDPKDRLKWNDDIELWILKNVLELKGGEYSAEYTYRFNNGCKLHIGNY